MAIRETGTTTAGGPGRRAVPGLRSRRPHQRAGLAGSRSGCTLLPAAALTADGFFKTGDLGRIDADGFLYITGRKKDLIIVAGEKASPREIEDVLARHPSVADAAVLGKKDPSRGEVVVAFVTAREGQEVKADVLRDFCRSQGLAQWKCPREIMVVADLPRSPTGKVLKRVLAEQLEAK